MVKRAFDMVCSLLGLIFLAPLFIIVAGLIKIDSPGPVFFRQQRVGRGGVLFEIHKFRTMTNTKVGTDRQITVGDDARITRLGRTLRAYKLDELPQLIDVARGVMSLVGPRPEVPKYVACYPEDVRARVLSIRPGITDWSSIFFRNESELLAEVADPEHYYAHHIVPIKLRYHLDYLAKQGLATDLLIIVKTLASVFVGSRK